MTNIFRVLLGIKGLQHYDQMARSNMEMHAVHQTGFLLATAEVIIKRYIFALCKLYINHIYMFHNSG